MILSILSIGGILLVTLVTAFWGYIKDFLNGPVRDLLEKIFGVEHCQWYSNFLIWADKKITAPRRVIKMQWKKFRENVLKVKSHYVQNDDRTYTKTSESIVRSSPTSGRRVVVEETVGWEYLPDSVRAEMLRLRTKEAELDDKAVAEGKFRMRAEEEGIELTA